MSPDYQTGFPHRRPKMAARLFSLVLDVYLSAILEIAETIALGIYPDMGETYRQQLAGLKGRLVFQPDAKTLEESRNTAA